MKKGTDGNYTIKLKSDASLKQYQSATNEQGKGYWIGVLIDTGIVGLEGLKLGESALDKPEDNELEQAQQVGSTNNSTFVLWLKVSDKTYSKSVTLSTKSGATKTFTIKLDGNATLEGK